MNFSEIMINGILLFGSGIFLIVTLSFITYKIRIARSGVKKVYEEPVTYESQSEREIVVKTETAPSVRKIRKRERRNREYSSGTEVFTNYSQPRYKVINRPVYDEFYTDYKVAEVAFN